VVVEELESLQKNSKYPYEENMCTDFRFEDFGFFNDDGRWWWRRRRRRSNTTFIDSWKCNNLKNEQNII